MKPTRLQFFIVLSSIVCPLLIFAWGGLLTAKYYYKFDTARHPKHKFAVSVLTAASLIMLFPLSELFFAGWLVGRRLLIKPTALKTAVATDDGEEVTSYTVEV